MNYFTSWTRTIKTENQDAFAYGDGAFTVLDGATPLGVDDAMDAATSEFVKSLATELVQVDSKSQSLRQQVADSLRRSQHNCKPCGVTSTLAIVMWSKNSLDVGVLGDSEVWIRFNNSETHRVVDPSFEDREKEAIDGVVNYFHSGLDADDAYARVVEQLAKDREKRNTESGLWVISDTVNPQNIRNKLHVESFSLDAIESVVAISDGALALSETLGIVELQTLLWNSNVQDLDEAFELALAIQNQDPQKIRYPRISNKDDATLVRLRFR